MSGIIQDSALMWLLWFLMCFPWRPKMSWNPHNVRLWRFKLIWTIYFCVSPKALCTTLTLLFLPLKIIYQGHGLCGPSCSSQSYNSILSINHKATLYTQKSPVCCEFVSTVFPICLCILKFFTPLLLLGVPSSYWWLVSLACSLICQTLRPALLYFSISVLYLSFYIRAVYFLTCFWKIVILGLRFGDMTTGLRCIKTNQDFIFSHLYLTVLLSQKPYDVLPRNNLQIATKSLWEREPTSYSPSP